MQDNKSAYIFLTLTTLFWGGNAIAGKLAVGHISPMILTSCRWGLALLLLVAIGGRQFWQDRRTVGENWLILAVYGAMGFTFFNIALYSALNHTSAINAAIEQSAVPAVIFIANYLLYRTHVTALQIVGFSMSLIGVAFVASNGDLQKLAGLQINRGDAYMALGVVIYAIYSVILRYKPELDWKSMMIAMSFFAFIVSLPFSYYELQTPQSILPDSQGWMVVLYAAIFPSIVSQVLWIKGIGLIGANRAGVFINLVPIIGTLLAVVLLDEIFALHHAIALCLVIGGIWIAERSGRRTAELQAR